MSQNPYSYAQDNPTDYVDPTGHFVIPLLPPDWNPFVKVVKDLARDAVAVGCWIRDEYQRREAQQAFDAGQWVTYAGADGVNRAIRSRVKEQPGLLREGGKIGQAQSEEINSLLNQFLNGNPNPGIGNGYLKNGIFYLRGANGGRIFLRRVGENAFEILGYADKSNEDRVIRLILAIYGK